MAVQLNLLYDGDTLFAGVTKPELISFRAIPASQLREDGVNGEELLGISLDEIEVTRLVLLTGVVHETLLLPFSDRRIVAQTTPVQLQDSFPFDFSDFVIDVEPTGAVIEEEHLSITGICPKTVLADALSLCRALGVEPRVVSSAASLLSAVPLVNSLAGENTVGAVFVRKNGTSTALFSEGRLIFLRDSPLLDFRNAVLEARLALEKGASLLKLPLDRVLLIGGDGRPADELSSVFGAPTSQVVLAGAELRSPEEELCVLAATHSANRSWGLQFRKGDFAYRASFSQIISGLGEELPYVLWAVGAVILWGLLEIGGSYFMLDRVNSQIASLFERVIPGAAVAEGRERSYIGDKLTSVEEELRKLGSLSSVSPLQSISGVSEAVSADLDLSIETMTIAQSTMVLNGTVVDTPAVGRLSSALEQREGVFCNVTVSPQGKLPGTSRARFTANLVFCE